MLGNDTAGSAEAPAQREEAAGDKVRKPVRALPAPRDWSLRSKLTAVLIVPTLTALVLAGLRVSDGIRQADEFQQTADQVDFAVKVTALVHEIQGERSLAIARISSGDQQRQAALDAQATRVDRGVDDVRSAAGRLKTEDQAAKDRYDRGLQRLDALRPLRAAASGPSYPDISALDTYSAVIDQLVQLGGEVNSAVTDRDLLRQGATVQALGEAKEFLARGDTALLIAGFRQNFPGELLDQVRAAQASGTEELDTFKATATPAQRQFYADTFSGPEVDDRQQIRTQALAVADLRQNVSIDTGRLTTDSTVAMGKLRAVESNLLSSFHQRADNLANAASTSAWWVAGIVLIALAAALAMMLWIARLMLRPLRILRATALDVAYTRLPETVQAILDDPDPLRASRKAIDPVPVTSTDEIGEVARSFDVVHEQAVRMAAEQALLRENVNGIFVNLSRRSQRLVERQLGVIDRLEADEQDPDHLASLFELDHLATRLRRNGESLLVLSGAGLAKSVPKPVPAADVIGAAVSEIEQYARIEVGVVPDVAVQGLTIHDLVHVLAELLDNATYFSEPETKITVRAVVTRKNALAIQVTDHGVGMSEEQIAEVNQRLADPPELDVSVTRRMGLYVVARLARRHGIQVRLRENEDMEGGLIARVVVPAELLTPLRLADLRTSVFSTKAETSSQTIPPANRPPDDTPLPANRPPAPEPPRTNGKGGLVPLDEPIRLDDLVAGTSAAGPYLSPAWPTSEDLTAINGEGASSAAETQFTRLVLPTREPKYVPVAPEEPEPPAESQTDPGVLEEEVPTRRLPIYQSVLSRWFSEVGEDELLNEPLGRSALPVVGSQEETQDGAIHDDNEPQELSGDGEEPFPATGAATEWQSASDNGWQAAQALLESKNEEITPAGLPKRVPNAYLVPGSIGPTEQDVFTDVTIGQPGKGAIARSATAARTRMASFQRGYTSGRHAMKEQSAAAGPDGEGVSVSGAGSSFVPDDSSEEQQ